MNVKMEHTTVELTRIVLIMKGTTPVVVPLATSGMERHVKVQ